ncbi:hypothetical protein L596_024755 [Steinernema carpocapsae]|uniref:Phosphatidylethanolamine-binding protein n=1 Tax=Steinernema carpocapsae TaxID=34508 RepID=A0A4U5M5Q0_STECR|nr:hypothetical protein L596_024755 [Steinernema carpocapsae]
MVAFGKGIEANLGNELTPRQVQNAPQVTWEAKEGALYTLAMIDPDVPSRAYPNLSQGLHWLIVNIPGDDIGKGDVFAEYVGAGPAQGTGLHRFIYLVFRQNGKVSDRSDIRRGFRIDVFAREHGLGTLVAGNFFQAQWHE